MSAPFLKTCPICGALVHNDYDSNMTHRAWHDRVDPVIDVAVRDMEER